MGTDKSFLNNLLRKIRKVILWLFSVIVILFLLIFLLLLIPGIQNLITSKAEGYLTEKLHTKVEIGTVRLALPKAVMLKNIYVEDLSGDTLLYSHMIKVDLNILALIRKRVQVNDLMLQKITGNVFRNDTVGGFNFDFIIQALASEPDRSKMTESDISSSGWDIHISQLALEDILLTFRDDVNDIDTRLDLGFLQLRLNEMDLEQISFNVEDLFLKDIDAFYAAPKAGQRFDFNIGASQLLRNKINISKQLLDLGMISFSNTDISILQEKQQVNSLSPNDTIQTEIEKDPTTSSNLESFQILPGWIINLDELVFKDNRFRMDNMNHPEMEGAMDFNHLLFEEISTKIKDIRLEGANAGLSFSHLALVEKSGLKIIDFKSQISVDSIKTLINDFSLETSGANIHFNLIADYPSIESFVNDISTLSFDLDINNTTLDWADMNRFIPGGIPAMGESKNTGYLDLNLKVAGSLKNFDISHFSVKAGENTEIHLDGSVKNVLDINNLYADLHLDSLFTTSTDLNNLLDDKLFAGLNLPPEIVLKSDIKGSMKDLSVVLLLNTSFGNIDLQGKIENDTMAGDKFKADVNLYALNVGAIISDTTIGTLYSAIEVSGSGLMDSLLKADYSIYISQAGYNGYNYSGINIHGNYSESKITTQITSEDPNLDLIADLVTEIKEEVTNIAVGLNLKNVNLMPLNFYPEDLSLKTIMDFSIAIMDSSQLSADAGFEQMEIWMEDIEYPVGSIVAHADLLNNATAINLNSDFLEIDITSNFNISILPELFKDRTRNYFLIDDTLQIPSDYLLEFDINVKNTDLLTEVFVKDIEALEVNNFSGYWNGNREMLFVSVDIPGFSYKGAEIDTIYLEVIADSEEMDYVLKLDHIDYDTLYLNSLSIEGTLKNGILTNNIIITDKFDSLKYSIPIQGEIRENEYLLSLLSEDLILNYATWMTGQDDFIRYDSSGMLSGSVSLMNGEQLVVFNADKGINDIRFKDFKLSTFTSLVNLSDSVSIIDGIINGRVDMDNSTAGGSIAADIGIADLFVLGQPLGTMDIKLKNPSPDQYLLDLVSEYENNRLEITGSYAKEDQTPIDFSIDLDLSNLKTFEPFLASYVSELSGAIEGRVELKGSPEDLDYSGELDFNQTQVRVNSINTLFTLPRENITINKNKISLNQLTLLDRQKNEFTIDGHILIDPEKDFSLDLKVHSDQFTFINSTSEDNDRFFGKLLMGTDFEIYGDASNPVINANINILNQTDLTYILPGSSIKMVTGDGIVNFIDIESVTDSLELLRESDFITDTILSKIPGVELTSILTLQPEAKFTVIIDPSSGDYVTISGLANLNMSFDKSKTATLSGTFEVSEGFYQVSFYNLVKKKFEITQGSAINWSGDPMDGLLNITAEYIIRTSSYGLLSSMSGQMSEVERALYNQRIPYHVKLMITGSMKKPEIRFGLDVPDRFKAELPTLASAINRLNQEDYESELNKQVFALLVTGTFIPQAGGSDGGSYNFATTAARNSVNGILAEQLNSISGQYIKGIDLNFGLTSFDSYGESGSGTRTELDVNIQKKLFHERVTIEAAGTFDLSGEKDKSSNVQTYSTYGEFSIYYDLNEYKDLKAKVFSERAYDLFDGEIMTSGVGIIIQKEFNDMAELKEERVLRKERKRKKKSEKRKVKSEK